MKPVSTAIASAPKFTSTVLACPPIRDCFSKSVTSLFLPSNHAAPSPEIPAPITAMRMKFPASQLLIIIKFLRIFPRYGLQMKTEKNVMLHIFE